MCQYKKTCWRHAYSVCLLEQKIPYPPTRRDIMLNGYIHPSAYPKGGLYAKNFPVFKDGEYLNLCPCISFISASQECEEFIIFEKKLRRVSDYKARLNRVNLSTELRKAIAKKCKYTCTYCGRNINSIGEDGEKIKGVIDHIIPLAKGGTNEEENLTLACRECNSKKGDEIWERPTQQNF